MDDLTNVHTAMSKAVQETNKRDETIQCVISFKVNEQIRTDATSICHANGTTLAEFLRQCCIGLIQDYRE